MRAQFAVWPAAAGWLWLLVRPACTAMALAFCLVALIVGVPFWTVAGITALVVAIRPIRQWWMSIVVAVLGGLAFLPIGVAVMAGMIAGYVALRLGAGSSRRGVLLVRCGRRALVGVARPHAEKTGLRRFLRAEDDDVFELVGPAAIYWIATWTQADPVALCRATAELARGFLLWDWPVATGPQVEMRLMRLAMTESAIRVVSRLAAVAVAVSLVVLTGSLRSGSVFGWTLPAWLAAVSTALMTWSLTRSTATKVPPIIGPVLLTMVSFILYGWLTVWLLGCALAVVPPTRFACAKLSERLLSAQTYRPRLPVFVGSPWVREAWTAARMALEDKRYRIADRLWAQLATDDKHTSSIRSHAAAARAHVALITGRIQAAVEAADTAWELASGLDRVPPAVTGTMGRVLLAAGDTGRATRVLAEAVKVRSQRRNPLVLAAHAQALAMNGADTESTLLALGKSTGGLLRAGNLEQLIETEMAVASVLAERTPSEAMEERLLELLSLADIGAQTQIEPGQIERLEPALGRVRLLLGRLQLERAKPETAEHNLRSAINALRDPADGFEQSIARIVLGCSKNLVNAGDGLHELAVGIRQLESLRGQLALGRSRRDLIIRHDKVYRAALDALTRIQEMDDLGGLLALELVESLKRNALAGTLREESRDHGDGIKVLRRRIEALEASEHDQHQAIELASLHEELAAELSAEFAAAYLPEAVDLPRLRGAVGDSHCLIYAVDQTGGALSGHVVWLSPAGRATTTRVRIDDPDVLAVLDVGQPEYRRQVLLASQSEPREVQRWRALAEALLPRALRAELVKAVDPLSLIVVPGSVLSALPWPALRLEDGRLVLESAVIQMVPALAVLTEAGPAPAPGPIVTYLDTEICSGREQAALELLHHELVASRNELLDALHRSRPSGAYIAVHGDGVGLEQHLQFHDGSRLSAATALTLDWPSWVVFAACFVGHVRGDRGEEPLGLPISCVLGGATAVIGGIAGVGDVAAGRLAPDIVRRIVEGSHPAAALREAQLAYVRSKRRTPPPAYWAGFVCISRTTASAVQRKRSDNAIV
jgi:CHAT domain